MRCARPARSPRPTARGWSRARDLSPQTEVTYQPGQDHRLLYDPAADLSTRVAQSMASSLEHLETDYDALVWVAIVKERDAGRIRPLDVSNVSLRHLEQMVATGAETPAFVQNRGFTRGGWQLFA